MNLIMLCWSTTNNTEKLIKFRIHLIVSLGTDISFTFPSFPNKHDYQRLILFYDDDGDSRIALRMIKSVLSAAKRSRYDDIRGTPRRPCVNHLRNDERYAIFRWLTICFAIGKGDSLYGTNTLRKTSDKCANAAGD